MDGGRVEVEVTEDVGEVGREVDSEGGVGAEAAMWWWRGGRGWMRDSLVCTGGEDLTGDCARGDCLCGFVPGSAVEGWWVGIGGGVDEAYEALGGVDAEFADSRHHGSLVEVMLDVGEEGVVVIGGMVATGIIAVDLFE